MQRLEIRDRWVAVIRSTTGRQGPVLCFILARLEAGVDPETELDGLREMRYTRRSGPLTQFPPKKSRKVRKWENLTKKKKLRKKTRAHLLVFHRRHEASSLEATHGI